MKSVLSFLFLVAFTALCRSQTSDHPDTYTGEFERSPVVDPHFASKIQGAGREQQEQFRYRVSIADAVGDAVQPEPVQRSSNHMRAQVTSPKSDWLEEWTKRVSIVGAAILATCLVLRRIEANILKPVKKQLGRMVAAIDPRTLFSTKVRAEEQALAEFLLALKAGPAGVIGGAAVPAANDSASQAAAVNAFHESAPTKLETLQRMLEEIQRTHQDGRSKIVAALRWEIHALRSDCAAPALLLVWQIAFAVEGLLKQLAEKPDSITRSALRTVAGGLELIKDLCRPGIDPQLLNRESLRLLVAADDFISRNAISYALKRTLVEPSQAVSSDVAMAMAPVQRFDVVFVDVGMSRLNCAEICSAFGGTAANRNTPVVFVTDQSDFENRAGDMQGCLVDPLVKPFLTLEITVMTLTLALRRRLSAASASTVTTRFTREFRDSALASQAFATPTEAVEEMDARQIAKRFLTTTTEHLVPVSETFEVLFRTLDPTTRRDLLADVYVYVHSFTPFGSFSSTHPAVQVGAATEGLVRKLMDEPRKATDSTLFTLAAGIQVLDELSRLPAETDLVGSMPLRILVADDDPVSRRATSVALQMSFEKPESVESGDGALALAQSRPYDVIFMEAQMPGIDGFGACSSIRQTQLNNSTPVVFVVGDKDYTSRGLVAGNGGNDFIERPFLTSELTLKALLFALRGRLNQSSAENSTAVSRMISSQQPVCWETEIVART